MRIQTRVKGYESTWTSACLFPARAGNGVLLGPLETGLAKFTVLVSWLLGHDLNEEIDPLPDPVCTCRYGEPWAALALAHTMLQVCAALFCTRVGLQSLIAADRCGLLGLPSLTSTINAS